MSAKRVQLARALDRVGVLGLVLEARARALLPWKSLTVLTFHRVARAGAAGFDPDVSDTTPEAFDRQVAMLKRYFTLIDTAALDAHRSGAPLPPNPALITFDDGYRDNHDEALPILRRHDAKAVFFVATQYVDERRLFWWERINRAVAGSPEARLWLTYPEDRAFDLSSAAGRHACTQALLAVVKKHAGLDLERFLGEIEAAARMPLDRDEERHLADALLMSWEQVRALKAAGMDVQSHTHAHRILQTLTDDEVTADLRTSRSILEAQIDAPVYALAYPAGKPISAQPGLRRAVRRAGIRLGLTTSPGSIRVDRSLDWLGIPRVTVERDMSDTFFRGCLAFPQLAY
jgi:peptidoglycan/xylan/chitin deacetylase (PgdA/CDA1 family)